jgi:predicted MPP superfamily phosphohydrolase
MDHTLFLQTISLTNSLNHTINTMPLFTLIFRMGLFFAFLVLIDLYAFQGIKHLTQNISSDRWKLIIRISYWVITIGFYLLPLSLFLIPSAKNGPSSKWVTATIGTFVLLYLPKLTFIIFLLFDDIIIWIQWIIQKINGFKTSGSNEVSGNYSTLTRSDFLVKSGAFLAMLPFASVAYGILKGRYEYVVRNVKVPIKNLPSDFEGFKILQISDLHTGSFDDKEAVAKGFELIHSQKADIICFTGDLVNNKTEEALPYQDLLSGLSAPMGVYSILGNHDYGDYVRDWKLGEKEQNFKDMLSFHEKVGWKLMMNEHTILTKGTSSIALIGIENWGARAGFPKYGKLDKAIENMPEVPVKVLLSHDPSHWDAQVRTKYPEINLTLSGHTHGFQFGVDILGYQWSPVQFIYKQWAGLYQENQQAIYVNRGFGFIGFPGRVGILPEITVLELTQA